ncbi:MAG: ATP cone domain-containing protein [Candidatus Micrarchaeia archaeon]
MKVRKKDGKEEEFIREKIVVAIVKSGSSLENARAIAKEVENAFLSRDAVTTEEIKNEVLKRLKERDAAAYRSWLDYNNKNKKR